MVGTETWGMPGPSIEVHARLSANVKAFGKALVG